MVAKTLVLVITPTPEESEEIANLITARSVDAKSLCPPKGLPGLLGSLNSHFSSADVVVLSIDVFDAFNNVNIISTIRAIKKAKPNIMILVYRNILCEDFSKQNIIDAGAIGVFDDERDRGDKFTRWINRAITGENHFEVEPTEEVIQESVLSSPEDLLVDVILGNTHHTDTTDTLEEEQVCSERDDEPEKSKAGASEAKPDQLEGATSLLKQVGAFKEFDNNQILVAVLKGVIAFSTALLEQVEKCDSGKSTTADFTAPDLPKGKDEVPVNEEVKPVPCVDPPKFPVEITMIGRRKCSVRFDGITLEMSLVQARIFRLIVHANGSHVHKSDIVRECNIPEHSIYTAVWCIRKSLTRVPRFAHSIVNIRGGEYRFEIPV